MVAAAGERFLDMAIRLRYAGVDFALEADPITAAAKVGGDRVDIVATYTAFVGLLRRLGHREAHREAKPGGSAKPGGGLA